MRPDQHKQKKNANYKKVHGIQATGGGKEKKSKGAEKDKTQDHAKETNKKKKELDINKERNVAEKAKDDGASSSDEERQFHRRQLVSNWNRYDDIPSEDEDDVPLQRGEDFNKLLTQAGGAAAHFRFKDEELWSGETETGETTVNVLSLNLQDVAASLNCIPLHERLTISQDLFSVEQLDEMTSHASDAHQEYDKTSDDTVCVMVQTKQAPDKQVKQDPVTPAADKHLVDSPSGKLSVNDSISRTVDSETNKLGNDSKSVSLEVKSLEDDLDMLLSSDDVPHQAPTVPAVVKAKQSTNHTTTSHAPKISVKGSACIQQKGEKKDDNLEDWLDSMLDD